MKNLSLCFYLTDLTQRILFLIHTQEKQNLGKPIKNVYFSPYQLQKNALRKSHKVKDQITIALRLYVLALAVNGHKCAW